MDYNNTNHTLPPDFSSSSGPSRKKFIFSGILTLVAVLAIPLTVFVASQVQNFRSRAEKPEDQSAEVQKTSSEAMIISNEVLIKVKREAKEKIKDNSTETEIPDLNTTLKEHKVKSIEKVAKEVPGENQDDEVYRWYKLTIDDQPEVIHGKFDQDKGIFVERFPDEQISKEILSQRYKRADRKEEKEKKKNPKKDQLEEFIKKLKKNENIETVQPNYIARASMIPNDPYFSSSGSWGQSYRDLWNLDKVQAAQAWDRTQGANVVVAVLDSGVDYNHPEIAANIKTNSRETAGNGVDDDGNGYIDDVRGWDFTTCTQSDPFGNCLQQKSPDNDPMDGHGHGTHVSGTIAAIGNNNLGIIGVAPQAKIMPLKGLDNGGLGYFDQLSSGIVYAANNGAQVMNNSWGCGFCPYIPIIEDAVRYAHGKGLTIVFAAGNDPGLDVRSSSPINMKEVIAVAASDQNDQLTFFSSWGTEVDITAPGGGVEGGPVTQLLYRNILSLKSNVCVPDMCPSQIVVGGQYLRQAGTSMAAPLVAGVAALVKASHPTFSNTDIRQAIRASADPMSFPGFYQQGGPGRVNANKAVAVNSILQASLTSPKSESRISQQTTPSLTISGTAAGPDFKQYELYYTSYDMYPQWVQINSASTTQVTNGTLGTWNISMLPQDIYMIKLVAIQQNGTQFTDTIRVRLDQAQVRRITNNLALSYDPVISGDFIVWKDNRDTAIDYIFLGNLYSYDLKTNTERRVFPSQDPERIQEYVDISGTRIVYHDNSSLFTYDFASSAQSQMVDTFQTYGAPSISGTNVAYLKYGTTGVDKQYFVKNLQANTEKQITNATGFRDHVRISGTKLVWDDDRNGNADIYMYDLATNTEKRITTNTSGQYYPAVSGNYIVWEDSRNGNADIYMYDLTTNTERQLTRDSAFQVAPAIEGTNIVWVDFRNNETAIYYYDLVTQSEHKLVSRGLDFFVDNEQVRISGKRVVWSDISQGNPEIFTAEIPSYVSQPIILSSPSRIVDTRPNSGLQGAGKALQGYDKPSRFTIGGNGSVPTNARGALLNIAVTNSPTSGGYLVVWPADSKKPSTSNINYSANQSAIANMAVVGLGNGSAVEVAGAAGLNVIIDVVGYIAYDPVPSSFAKATLLSAPVRMVDTRSGSGFQGAGVPLKGYNTPNVFTFGGQGQIPASANAVIANVTTTGHTSDGYITAWRVGQSKPNTANINYSANESAITNMAYLPIGSNGQVNIVGGTGVHVIIDVVGYIKQEVGSVPIPPTLPGQLELLPQSLRIVDTRTASGFQGAGQALKGFSTPVRFAFGGQNGIPTNAKAIVANITAFNHPSAGHLTAWAAGQPMPGTANLNYSMSNPAIGGLSTIPLGVNGSIDVVGATGTLLIIDVMGYIQ